MLLESARFDWLKKTDDSSATFLICDWSVRNMLFSYDFIDKKKNYFFNYFLVSYVDLGVR